MNTHGREDGTYAGYDATVRAGGSVARPVNRWHDVLGNIALMVVYAAAARLGLAMDAVSGFATLVWPPTGIALAALLLFGFRLWPGVALGACIANLWAGAPIGVAFGIALGNTLEAVIGVTALRRLDVRPSLASVREVVALILAGALLSTLIAATIGSASLLAGGVIPAVDFWATWRAWWLGDGMGALIIAPLLLTWSSLPRPPFARRKILEAAALGLVSVALGVFVFSDWITASSSEFRQERMLFPLLVWAALRFGQRGVTALTFFFAALAIFGTFQGTGPFASVTLRQSLGNLHVFMAAITTTMLVLGAVMSERRKAQQALAQAAAASHEYAEASLDLGRALLTVARATTDALGDTSLVVLLSEDGRSVAAAAAHPDSPEARALCDAILSNEASMAETGFDRILGAQLPLLLPRLDPEDVRRTAAPRYRAYFDRHPAHSLLAVPLAVQRRIIGALGLVRHRPGQPYAADDKTLLDALADRAALALENARLYRRAQQAIDARDEFLSVASHELRTPLSALVLQLDRLKQMIERGAQGDDQQKLAGKVEAAVRASSRLTQLVDTLLDVSRGATRRLDLRRERCDLVQIARDVVERVSEQALRADCVLYLRSEEPAVGVWDRVRLEQVLFNLLSNAIKYGPAGPIEIEIAALGERVTLTVKDYGIGIAESDSERIFGAFERAVPIRHYGGLGLGLYVTRQIVEAHGGTVRVKSQRGAGSTFIIELPWKPPARAGAEAPPAAVDGASRA